MGRIHGRRDRRPGRLAGRGALSGGEANRRPRRRTPRLSTGFRVADGRWPVTLRPQRLPRPAGPRSIHCMGGAPATASPLVRRYSLEEFFALELPPGHGHYELIAGVLYIVPPPTSRHD